MIEPELQPDQPFRPFIAYDPHGDIIEAFWEPDSQIGKYVMPGLTLYMDRDTERVIGFLVDGVEMVKRRKMIVKGDATR